MVVQALHMTFSSVSRMDKMLITELITLNLLIVNKNIWQCESASYAQLYKGAWSFERASNLICFWEY